jgi:hypothetical protein
VLHEQRDRRGSPDCAAVDADGAALCSSRIMASDQSSGYRGPAAGSQRVVDHGGDDVHDPVAIERLLADPRLGRSLDERHRRVGDQCRLQLGEALAALGDEDGQEDAAVGVGEAVAQRQQQVGDVGVVAAGVTEEERDRGKPARSATATTEKPW